MENSTVSRSPLDTYQYEYHKVYTSKGWDRIKEKIGDFLCFCAGADTQILAYCPHSDRIKEQGIGGVVLATTVLAFFSGSYAFYTVFSPKVPFLQGAVDDSLVIADIGARIGAFIFGLIWALIIFNLDRFIVSSTGHGDGTHDISGKEFINAIPRLLMAFVIGFTLSKPLEIKIMESEIAVALYKEQLAERKRLNKETQENLDKEEVGRKEERAKIEAEGGQIFSQLKKFEDAYLERQKEAFEECSGKGGSGIPGKGPRCDAAKERITQAEQMLAIYRKKNEAVLEDIKKRTEEINKKIEGLADKREAEKKKNENEAFKMDGLIKRIEIAHKESPVSSWALTFLLMVIEVTPIFFKMMLKTGPYDYFSENQRRISVATRGIRVRDDVADSNGKGIHIVHMHDLIYEEAERITKHEAGKLQTEQYLTEVAHQRFREVTEEDIKANLSKYMGPDRPAS